MKHKQRASSNVLSRRNFLRVSGYSIAALAARRLIDRFDLMAAFAAGTPGYRALVCIFLLGGNDSNNMIVPLDSRYAQYSALRGNLALGQLSLLPITDASGASYGLHPSLPEIQDLYNQGVAAFQLNVGTLVQPVSRAQISLGSAVLPENLQAHDSQQAEWQTGMGASVTVPTGWGGRIADLFPGAGGALPASISIAGMNLFLAGKNPTGCINPGALGVSSIDDGTAVGTARHNAFQQIINARVGTNLTQAADARLAASLQMRTTLAAAMAGVPALATNFPNSDLGAQLQLVAKIIQVASRLGATSQVFFCTMNSGGFDTHTAQLQRIGLLYPILSQALDSFYKATEEMGVQKNVVAFTASDFNRMFRPNSADGSDHGWGGHQLVVGGAVRTGVYGTMPIFQLSGPDDAFDSGVWIPSISLQQYGATLASWFGVGATDISTVFPQIANFPVRNLGFLN